MYAATNMQLDARIDKENILQNPPYIPPFLFYQIVGFIHRSGRANQYPEKKISMPSGQAENEIYLNSKHALAKMIGLVLGINCLFVTFYIHIDSPWYTRGHWRNCSMVETLKKGNILEWIEFGIHFKMTVDHCPPLTMERFLIGTNFVILVVSGIGFFCSCWASLETVNAVRSRESFYNAISGIIIIIGAALFAVSTGKISQNICETKPIDATTFKKTDLCDMYFLDSNKYVAACLGIIEGVYFICLACLLDNMKLFGLKTGSAPSPRRRDLASVEADVENQDGNGSGSGQINTSRKSVARSTGKRRSSINKYKKGVGSFGALTNNMTGNNSSKLQKGNTPPPSQMSRNKMLRKDQDKEHEKEHDKISGSKSDTDRHLEK